MNTFSWEEGRGEEREEGKGGEEEYLSVLLDVGPVNTGGPPLKAL